MSGVAKIIGGVFAIAGIGEGIKKVVTAATSEQAAFLMMDKTITNARQSTVLYGHSINDVIKAQARHSGFMVTDLASAYTRIAVGAKTTQEAYHNLGLAEDVARFRHMDLAQAGTLLARVEQGVTTGLTRVGIIIPKVTAAQDKLSAAHDKAVASGTKFTKAQALEYKNSLELAKAKDKETSKTNALAALQQKVGGLASKYAASSAGQLAKAGVAMHEMEVEIGGKLLPVVAQGAAGFVKYTTEIGRSTEVQSAVASTAHEVASGFGALVGVVKDVGPPLLAVAEAGVKVASSIGAPAILAAVAAYQGMGIATRLAAAGQAFYVSTVAAGVAAQTALGAATEGATVAMMMENAQAELGIATTAEQAVAADALAASLTGVTAAEIATGEAMMAESGGMAAFGTGLASMVGPQAILIAGGAILAGGIAYLVNQTDSLTAANQRATDSTNKLAGAMNAEKDAAKQVADLKSNIISDKNAVADARLAAARARTTVETWKGSTATLAYKEAVQAEKDALDRLRVAHKQLADDKSRLTDAYHAQAAAIGKAAGASRDELSRMVLLASMTSISGGNAVKFATSVTKQANAIRNTNPLLGHNLDLLSAYARSVGSISRMKPKEIKLILSNRDAKKNLDAFPGMVQGMIATAAWTAATGGEQIGSALGSGVAAGIYAQVGSAVAALNALTSAALGAGKAHIKASSPSKVAAKEIGAPLAWGIAMGITAEGFKVHGALTALIGTAVSDARAQVLASVGQAKQGLISGGGTLAGTIGTVLDTRATGQTTALGTSPAAQRISAIQAQLDDEARVRQEAQLKQAVSDSTDITAKKAAQQDLNDFYLSQEQAALQASLTQKQDAIQTEVDAKKAAAERNINNLDDELNRGKISRKKYDKELLKLLAKDGIGYKALGKEFGIAFADEFRAELVGLKGQAAAIVATPKAYRGAGGAGYAVDIVRPLDAIHAGTKSIEEAVKGLDKSQKGLLEKILKALNKQTHTATKNTGIDAETAGANR